jgi:hypothetical protein
MPNRVPSPLLRVVPRVLAAVAACCLLMPAASCAPRSAAAMLQGPGAEVDPAFPYYKDRTAASIASEVAANGYKHVHYVATSDSAIRADLVDAFKKEGLPVWYLTFCHVAYSTADFPPGWEDWRMKLRASPGNDFTRLCMNDPGYTAFKRISIAKVMATFGFDGVELVEPFWPDVPGPERETYGCLCDDCQAAFLRDHPEETSIPEFTDADSPLYYKSRPALYKKWVDFRVRSIGRFLNAALADARKADPNTRVLVWSLAQEGEGSVALMRESQGNDAAAMAAAVHPDAVSFQTNWTDWSRSDLAPDYVRAYQPFLDHLKRTAPDVATTIQVDTGSLKPSRQTYAWLRAADAAAQKMGAVGTINYEYFITKSMYEDPPRLVWVRPREGGVSLVYQKRVDAGRAADVSNYHVTDAAGRALKVTGAKTDGNMVHLGVRGLAPGTRYTVHIEKTVDTPSRWLFPGYPAHTVLDIRKTFRLPQA